MNSRVTEFIANLKRWQTEIIALWKIAISCGLTEEYKWKQPCYTYEGKNVLILASLKEYCSIGFMKGLLLKDEDNRLISPGKNSNHTRILKFSTIEEIHTQEAQIKEIINEARDIEKQGLKVITPNLSAEDYPAELLSHFYTNPAFQEAFERLTPGRQRGYILYINGAKQSSTKTSRIKKHENRILQGYGIHDCTCGHSKRMPTCDGSHKFF